MRGPHQGYQLQYSQELGRKVVNLVQCDCIEHRQDTVSAFLNRKVV
jgi:hypothetical protein